MVLYVLLGLFVGSVGTALGLGGGIILTPALLYFYPTMKPEEVTAISLFCIAVNASSGSLSYLIKKKVHLPSAILFSIACLPGAWLGVQLTSYFDRHAFESIFGIFMVIIGAHLIFRKPKSHVNSEMEHWESSTKKYVYGFVASFFVGVVASFLGIGGGIIHVPLLVEVMLFPAHTAVATSHFILAVGATIASTEHYLNGSLNLQPFILYIALGILIGAPLGAKFSSRLKGSRIIQMIGGVVILVGLRFLYFNFIK